MAGEASGDLHGARLLSELRALAPGISFLGLGGDELRAAGMELVAESAEISVVGISEALRILPHARRILHDLLEEVDRRRIKAAVLIDFPDFNLRLARHLERRGVKIIYYISPQVWAWRRGRIRTISHLVDRMLVVLPFEVDFYHRFGIRAVHVGHPLVDEVPSLEQIWDRPGCGAGPLQIALLPGSRTSEIESNLPVMLQAAELLAQSLDVRFRLIRAPSLDPQILHAHLSKATIDLEVEHRNRFAALADSHLAICASGTATLEVGLLTTPMVVVYRVRPWTYLLGRLLVRLPHIALVNLVLEKRVVPELIQHDANATEIARHASVLLGDRDRIRSMRSDLAQLRGRLGKSGASRRAAVQVLGELEVTLPSGTGEQDS